jgi:predicted CopG family antitoxin
VILLGKTITVSDEVWAALDKMGTTSNNFDSVVRRLIVAAGKADYLEQAEELLQNETSDLITQLGERIPSDTKLRARFKGRDYEATVKNGHIVIGAERFKSPSMAAKFITGYNINGWYFWEAIDERDGKLKHIEALREYWNSQR